MAKISNKKFIFTSLILISSIWALLALWVQQPISAIFAYGLILLWLVFIAILIFYLFQDLTNSKQPMMIYTAMMAMSLIWFFNLSPSNDKNWNKEVAHNVDYTQNGDTITVYHVRNFHWRGLDDYDEKWETRHYDLSKLDGVDLVLSTWGIDAIAHTLLSFHFSDGKRLAFSIETRKEQHEEFSSINGFFRKYELAFIASDELDVIYTRTNIRTDETTYLYPIKLSKSSIRQLFLSYLERGKALQTQPQWYNSLTANCTTVIYDMVKQIQSVPFDYRIIASGFLPEYLYDHQVLDNQYPLADWKKMAYIQPKTQDFAKWADKSSERFSQVIRTHIPTP